MLRELSEAMVAARREAAAGRIADVVVHRRPDREGGYGALTDDFLRVRLPAEQVVPGGRMRVRLGLDGREARAVGADADGR